MIRKTLLGLAAAAAITGATASTASAGVHINLGFGPAWGGYHAPYYGHCKRVFWGYQKVWTKWGWKNKAVYRTRCW